MKLKALFIAALFVAGVACSVAVAKGPPPGKGKNKTSSTSTSSTTTTSGKGKGKGKKTSVATCKPNVSFVLKGSFAGSGGAAAPAGALPAEGGNAPRILGTFGVEVKQANNHGRTYVGQTVQVSYDAKTKFKRRGNADVEDFEEGDWLNVHVRACHPKKQTTSGSGTTTTTTTTTTTGPAAPGAQPVLLAKQVVGKPAQQSGDDSGDTGTGTTETTATTP